MMNKKKNVKNVVKFKRKAIPDGLLEGLNVSTFGFLEYKGVNIIVQNIGFIFQYIFYYKQQYYSNYSIINSEKGDGAYTDKQLRGINKYMLIAACATIDFLKGDKASKTDKELSNLVDKAGKLLN